MFFLTPRVNDLFLSLYVNYWYTDIYQIMTQPLTVKVVFLGAQGVGKSSLLARFVNDEFDEKITTTLGGAFFEKIHTYG